MLPRSPTKVTSAAQPEALPPSICSPVEFQGKGQPRFLITSDLPFQGQATLAETLQMTDAIRFVLAQNHFRAGPYSVGYQSCEDSIAATGNFDADRCQANARAYAGKAPRAKLPVLASYSLHDPKALGFAMHSNVTVEFKNVRYRTAGP